MKNFSYLKKNLKKPVDGFKKIKIAILGDTATQFLSIALQGQAIDLGLNLAIFEADFDQIESQIFDPSSELYDFKPEIVLVFESTHKLLSKFYKSKEDPVLFGEKHINHVNSLYQTLTDRLGSAVLYCNFPIIDNKVFGNYANKIERSFVYQLNKINFQLSVLAVKNQNLFIQDLNAIQAKYGRNLMFSPNVYVNSEMILSIDILPIIAKSVVDIIAALNGKFKKCLILDLDNTTWGGIIGDDGLEKIQIGSLGIGKAFTEFQYWVKALQQRGIIIAVCSKNDEDKAKEPFEKHPDMVLKLEDIAVFVANWENKADNIRKIQNILNIGFDSMVFLDDNPFERNMVRENLPEVCVPELPEDPAEYLEYLYGLNLFETVSFSENDAERTKQYQIEAERNTALESFTNVEDFLKNMDMISDVQEFNNFSKPRVSQLSQRSNQFNLRTVRYTEEEVNHLIQSDQHFTLSFTLEDKYGDNGLICVIVLEGLHSDYLFIESWFMSCRVLKRGMEEFTLNKIVETAKKNGFKKLIGEYIESPKNKMVQNHYENLGFKTENGKWILEIADYQPSEVNIKAKNN